jgi:hypothetical protein
MNEQEEEVLNAWETTLPDGRTAIDISTASFTGRACIFDPRITKGLSAKQFIGTKVGESRFPAESRDVNAPVVILKIIEHKEFQRLIRERQQGREISQEDAHLLMDSMIAAANDIELFMRDCVEEKYKYEEGSVRHEGWQGKADAYRAMWVQFANRWYQPIDRTLRAPQRFIDSRTREVIE